MDKNARRIRHNPLDNRSLQQSSTVEDSAPAPDGLPLSVWRAPGEVGIQKVCSVERHLRKGRRILVDFNCDLQVFLPEGTEDDDVTQVVQRAQDTRPLARKATANKINCAMWNHAFRRQAPNDMNKSQRGFVPGRQLDQKVVDLDGYARNVGRTSKAKGRPCCGEWEGLAQSHG